MDEVINSGRPFKIPEDAHYSLVRLACVLLLQKDLLGYNGFTHRS